MISVQAPRGKVLVVDDDPVVLAVVKEWLELAGYQVSTREEALGTAEWVMNERPDFVLLDVKMPALSGGELVHLLRRVDSDGRIVVILHSAMEHVELERLVEQTGASGCIQKTSRERQFTAQFERVAARFRAAKRALAQKAF